MSETLLNQPFWNITKNISTFWVKSVDISPNWV
nr:MAG TPA: hypothetical protein [Caudoviricetes sp.]